MKREAPVSQSVSQGGVMFGFRYKESEKMGTRRRNGNVEPAAAESDAVAVLHRRI